MNNLKSVETKSLSLLSSIANDNRMAYPVAVKVTELGGENRVEIVHAHNKKEMLDVIDEIAQAILESEYELDLKISRINRLSANKYASIYLN